MSFVFLRRILRILTVTAVVLFARPSSATFHLFTIDQIFSDATGTVQFVELSTQAAAQEFLSGHFISGSQGSVNNMFNFPTNLPGDTLNHKFLVATQGYAALGAVTPDYIVPNGFLPLPGGTVNYADVDSVTYASLPTDGIHSIDRNGNSMVNSETNFGGVTGSVTVQAASAPPPTPPAGDILIVEYYDAHDDQYFITGSPAEAAVIDSGADNIGLSTWSRTGLYFNAYPSPGPGNDVCRFFDPNIPPVGIHFYTALPAECAQVQATLPVWQFESGNVFNIPIPEAGGVCASNFLPVYRYFDQRVDESWRFTTDTTVNAAMLAKGWANEGVQMCSPQ